MEGPFGDFERFAGLQGTGVLDGVDPHDQLGGDFVAFGDLLDLVAGADLVGLGHGVVRQELRGEEPLDREGGEAVFDGVADLGAEGHGQDGVVFVAGDDELAGGFLLHGLIDQGGGFGGGVGHGGHHAGLGGLSWRLSHGLLGLGRLRGRGLAGGETGHAVVGLGDGPVDGFDLDIVTQIGILGVDFLGLLVHRLGQAGVGGRVLVLARVDDVGADDDDGGQGEQEILEVVFPFCPIRLIMVFFGHAMDLRDPLKF